MFLILIDAYSKWLEVVPLSTTTSFVTINNGRPFTSAEFQKFSENNGIRHMRSAPYPRFQWTGRAVQVFKEGMKKTSEGSLESRMAQFLFWNCLTPHTAGASPAELFGRIPRSALNLIRPSLSKKVHSKQQAQKENHDTHARGREFTIGDLEIFQQKALASSNYQFSQWTCSIEDCTGDTYAYLNCPRGYPYH